MHVTVYLLSWPGRAGCQGHPNCQDRLTPPTLSSKVAKPKKVRSKRTGRVATANRRYNIKDRGYEAALTAAGIKRNRKLTVKEDFSAEAGIRATESRFAGGALVVGGSTTAHRDIK